jgi:hypothetical protein
MPIPSLYLATGGTRPWNMARAANYGAGIGAIAGLFKTFRLVHAGDPASGSVLQVLAAAVVFAVLCAGAAALRNFIARRVVWHE